MKKPGIYTENAKQLLARIHQANVRAQIAAECLQVRDVAQHYAHVAPDRVVVDLLASIVMRTTAEMAIAHALGDAVPRLDLLVFGHIRELLGADMHDATRARVVELGGAWPNNAPGPWPLPLRPQTLQLSAKLPFRARLALVFVRFLRRLRGRA